MSESDDLLQSTPPISRSEFECEIQLLPCRIDQRVEGNISSFFPDLHDDTVEVAFLRGRKLVSRDHSLPEGWTGVVIASTAEETKETRELLISKETNTFSSLRQWNRELPINETNVVLRSFDWCPVSSHVRSPIYLHHPISF